MTVRTWAARDDVIVDALNALAVLCPAFAGGEKGRKGLDALDKKDKAILALVEERAECFRLREWVERWSFAELHGWLDEEIGCALAGEAIYKAKWGM